MTSEKCSAVRGSDRGRGRGRCRGIDGGRVREREGKGNRK